MISGSRGTLALAPPLRWLVLVLTLLLLVPAVPVGAKTPTAYDGTYRKLGEALRLERLAHESIKRGEFDEEALANVERSLELLDEIAEGPAGSVPHEARLDILRAREEDRRAVRRWPRGGVTPDFSAWSVIEPLVNAMILKLDALAVYEDAMWKEKRQKESEAALVNPPKCRNLAFVSLPGCTGTSYWELYVDKDAKRAKCTFRGPRGVLSAARPLFPGTWQQRSCRLAGFKTVNGERKRVVRAELRITVPAGVDPGAPKKASVTAGWK